MRIFYLVLAHFHFLLNLPILRLYGLCGTETLLQPLEGNEQGGNNKEQCQRTDYHTAHSSRTERTVTVGTHTGGHHQRQQTEYHGERGHEDRTQTGFGGADSRSDKPHTRLAALSSILRQQDSGLGKQTDQHNQTRLQVDVILQSHQLGEQEAAHQTYRNGEDYGKRHDKALVERTQNKVNHQDTDTEDDNRGAALLAFLTGDAAKVVTVAFGKRLRRSLLYGTDSVTRTVSLGRHGIHRNGVEHIETAQRLRAIRTCQ